MFRSIVSYFSHPSFFHYAWVGVFISALNVFLLWLLIDVFRIKTVLASILVIGGTFILRYVFLRWTNFFEETVERNECDPIPSQELHALYEGIGSGENDFRNANLVQLVAGYVLGEKVLDIGSGSGALLAVLMERGKSVMGIEENDNLVALSKQLHPGIEIIHGRAESVDVIEERAYDCVTMLDVLEHIEDEDVQIKRVATYLKHNGSFVIVVPAHQYLYGKRDRAMGHYRRYSKEALRDALSRNGFEVIKLRYWNMLGVFPYWFSEKILQKELQTSLRNSKQGGGARRFVSKILFMYFKYIENKLNLGFGLSLICVASLKK